MNIPRPFLTLAPAVVFLAVATYPSRGYAQQSHARPAVRTTGSPAPRSAGSASPTPKPSPTPTIIPAAPLTEMNEQSPPSDSADDSPVTETQIDATEGATFASKERIAVFIGNVRVTDPRFQLSCDKLTVFLNKSAAADTAGAPNLAATSTPASASTPVPLAAGNTPPAPGAKEQGGGGGIDHCVAEGHVIILQKRAPTKPGEEEKVSIGRGEKGTFDNKTGDMVLYGMPEIEQNGNSHSATSPDTVMTIHKDSSLDTKGPNTTRLIQHKGGGGGIELPGAPAVQGGNAAGKNKKKPAGAAPAASASPASR